MAVERHDHHHRCERSRRRDYLRSRRCGPGVLVTSHDRHVRHMRIGRGNAREQGCADDVTDLRQSDVSRTVAGHLVGPPRQPTRDRRLCARWRSWSRGVEAGVMHTSRTDGDRTMSVSRERTFADGGLGAVLLSGPGHRRLRDRAVRRSARSVRAPARLPCSGRRRLPRPEGRFGRAAV